MLSQGHCPGRRMRTPAPGRPHHVAWPACSDLNPQHHAFEAQMDQALLGPSEAACPDFGAWTPGSQSCPIPAPWLSTQASRGLAQAPLAGVREAVTQEGSTLGTFLENRPRSPEQVT